MKMSEKKIKPVYPVEMTDISEERARRDAPGFLDTNVKFVYNYIEVVPSTGILDVFIVIRNNNFAFL